MTEQIQMQIEREFAKLGYVALEMGAVRLVQRMIAAHRFNSTWFRRPDSNCTPLVADGVQELMHTQIMWVDRAGLRRSDLAEVFRNLARAGVEGVFVDYFQLIRADDDRTSLTEHLNGLAYWLAEEAKRMLAEAKGK